MTDLYSLMVVYKNAPHSLRFFFKTERSMIDAYDILRPRLATTVHETAEGTNIVAVPSDREIIDDYGNTATIDRDEIGAIVRTYVNEDLNAQGELALLQAHNNAKFQRRAATDPMLKTAVAVQPPFVNGRPQ